MADNGSIVGIRLITMLGRLDMESYDELEVLSQDNALVLNALALPLARRIMEATNGAAVVYDWFSAPQEFKNFSVAGGDEDHVVIHKGETGAYWSWKLSNDEYTVHIGDDIWITITDH